MTFLRTLTALVAVACTLVVALGGGVAAAGSSGDTYRDYAVTRQTMIGCSLDRTWHHLGSVKSHQCVSLRKLYVLWSEPGESGGFHLYCRTKKCPATPIGEPNDRQPIPRGANVFH
jgi:hypothetical protein